MRIPLEKRVKKRRQQDMGRLQDVLIDFVASLDTPAVFHGGTAIWRIYKGKRFSEDLDFYLVWENAAGLKEKLENFLKPYAANLMKFKETRNTLFINIERNGMQVKLEFSKQKKKGYVVGNYERMDGSFTSIYTLTPEELFKEKVSTYLSRGLARDLYDVISLYPLCEKQEIITGIRTIQTRIKPPVDEPILRTLVVEGLVPSYEIMKRTIQRW